MAPTVRAFEAKLDKFWKNQPVKFNFKSSKPKSNDLDKECIQNNPMMMMMMMKPSHRIVSTSD